MATGSLSGGNTDLRITHKELLSVDRSINQRKKIFKLQKKGNKTMSSSAKIFVVCFRLRKLCAC